MIYSFCKKRLYRGQRFFLRVGLTKYQKQGVTCKIYVLITVEKYFLRKERSSYLVDSLTCLQTALLTFNTTWNDQANMTQQITAFPFLPSVTFLLSCLLQCEVGEKIAIWRVKSMQAESSRILIILMILPRRLDTVNSAFKEDNRPTLTLTNFPLSLTISQPKD